MCLAVKYVVVSLKKKKKKMFSVEWGERASSLSK